VNEVQTNEIDEEEESNNRINTTMKSLVLRNLGNLDGDVSNTTLLLSVFKQCPMFEKVVVEFWKMEKEEEEEEEGWCEIIANNWQHLQSLTLQYAEWMINNELIMNALESCCGKRLKKLSIDGRVTNELIARICQSFVALESVELRFDGIELMQYPAMLQSFQRVRSSKKYLANFQSSQSRKILYSSHFIRLFRYFDLFSCFAYC